MDPFDSTRSLNRDKTGETDFPPPQSDDALAARAPYDSAAFLMLYRRHVNAVYHFVWTQVGDEGKTQELVSKTFLAALETIGNNPPHGKFLVWLLTLAWNQIPEPLRRPGVLDVDKSKLLEEIFASRHEIAPSSQFVALLEWRLERAHSSEIHPLVPTNQVLPGSTRSIALPRRWLGATIAVMLLVAAFLLAAKNPLKPTNTLVSTADSTNALTRLLGVKPEQTPTAQVFDRMPDNLDFESGTTNWQRETTLEAGYVTGDDYKIVHRGSASGFIWSSPRDENNYATLVEWFTATAYRGQRIKLTGFIKTENLDKQAGLIMRIEDGTISPCSVLAIDDMHDRPIRGTTDWTAYQIVMDVPMKGAVIFIGAAMTGRGKLWMDDLHIETVDGSIAQTDKPTQCEKISPANLGFEQDLTAWSKTYSEDFYTISTDSEIKHSGGASGLLQGKNASQGQYGTLGQTASAQDFRNQRIRLSAWIKTKDVENWTGLWLRIEGDNGFSKVFSFDDMVNRPIRGTNDWQRYEIIEDVPQKANALYFGDMLVGNGQVWMDDVQFESVDQSVGISSRLAYSVTPDNLGFEDDPAAWFGVTIDSTIKHSGRASALLIGSTASPDETVILSQTTGPELFFNRRVRITGYIKTQDVADWAGMYLWVYGYDNALGVQSVLAMDDMHNRPIRGTTDWQKYEIVVPVSEASRELEYGVRLDGTGKVWLDDVTLEIVGNEVPLTDLLR